MIPPQYVHRGPCLLCLMLVWCMARPGCSTVDLHEYHQLSRLSCCILGADRSDHQLTRSCHSVSFSIDVPKRAISRRVPKPVSYICFRGIDCCTTLGRPSNLKSWYSYQWLLIVHSCRSHSSSSSSGACIYFCLISAHRRYSC